jgi:hypothetical protein
MSWAFTFLLMYPDGEPCDPFAFATTELRWSVGDTVLIRPGCGSWTCSRRTM